MVLFFTIIFSGCLLPFSGSILNMSYISKLLISIIILFISAALVIPACNISDHSKYTQGSGILLKDSEHKPSIPQDFNQLKERFDALMPDVLEKYETVGAVVALIEPKRV